MITQQTVREEGRSLLLSVNAVSLVEGRKSLVSQKQTFKLLFGLLLCGQCVVQFRNTLFKLVHHQRPVLVEEHRH